MDERDNARIYLSFVDRMVKVVDNLVPTAVTPVMMTTEIRAAIKPYSIAIAPASSRKNFCTVP